ncbi:MAG: PD-(D/E)XK nuclease family protein [Leptolyngbyaceae cyanobacterium SM2_5_2]|nr:PD-(D/E)XK nuclease family protein [Leptolyngbyaceae cyanobacterium SM2_5_2]
MGLTTLTQGHLKLLELCPRRFQYSYLDQLATPTEPAMLARQQWGTRFHLVMQQRELGLAVAPLLAHDPALESAVQALLTTAPDLFAPAIEPGATALDASAVAGVPFRQSEHRRNLTFNGYGLTVIYDLLIITPTQGQIVDWKTYLHPPSQRQLTKDWQTRLYLYVLAETTDLAPEQLSMSYWFVQPQLSSPSEAQPLAQPSQILLPYSAAQHRRTERDLRQLTDKLTTLRATFQDFPKVEESQGHCLRCPFAVRCQRASERYENLGLSDLPPIEEIAEVSL